jgi:hypothetical protein
MGGSTEDDVILSVIYNRNTAWLYFITWCLVGCLFLLLCYYGALQRNYGLIILFLLTNVQGFYSTLALLVPPRILFCRDRIVQIQYLWGSRSIYYARARVTGPSGDGRWLHKVYHVVELNENRRPFFWQSPLVVDCNQLPPETQGQVDAIMAYLKECTQQGLKTAESCTLTRDVLCRDKVRP